jgi:hypothetical protein
MENRESRTPGTTIRGHLPMRFTSRSSTGFSWWGQEEILFWFKQGRRKDQSWMPGHSVLLNENWPRNKEMNQGKGGWALLGQKKCPAAAIYSLLHEGREAPNSAPLKPTCTIWREGETQKYLWTWPVWCPGMLRTDNCSWGSRTALPALTTQYWRLVWSSSFMQCIMSSYQ